MGSELPLFTELPRAFILGNCGDKKSRGFRDPGFRI